MEGPDKYLNKAVELALEQFWYNIAESYPNVGSGDMAPGEDHALILEAKLTVNTWLKNNS